MRKNLLLPAILAATTASCADMRWTGPGGDGSALQQDAKACRVIAAENAARRGTFSPPVTYDPRFGPAPGPTQMDLRVQERQEEERCMREKGYTLVPAAK